MDLMAIRALAVETLFRLRMHAQTESIYDWAVNELVVAHRFDATQEHALRTAMAEGLLLFGPPAREDGQLLAFSS